MQFDIKWIDHGREPQNRSNPAFPHGIHVDLTEDAKNANRVRLTEPSQPRPDSCLVELPYPAKRCGVYMIKCALCDLTVAVTTAGRPDDPRSIRLACKIKGTAQ